MNPTVEAVKRNLDLTSSKPLKICTYEAFKKTIILGDIPAVGRPFALLYKNWSKNNWWNIYLWWVSWLKGLV